MIASIRLDGSTACMALEGAAGAKSFRACVQAALRRPLRGPGTAVMDNLSPRKSDPAPALIARVGARVLFPPACFPDLNPIEMTWSKAKRRLRSVETKTRTRI